MEPARFRIRDAEDPSDARARADSENGERRTECGERRTEYGERSTEFVLRNGFLHSLRASVRDWDGACEIPDSRCGRSFGREGSSRFGERRTENGVRRTENGVRRTEYGIRSSEWIPSQPPSVGERLGWSLRDSGFAMRKILRTRGLEPIRRTENGERSAENGERSTENGVRNSFFGMDSFTASERR